MKKPLLLGGASVLFLLLTLSLGAQPSYSFLDLKTAYASLLSSGEVTFTEEDLAEHQDLITVLTSTGFTIEIAGTPYSFPAQMKDLVLKPVGEKTRIGFTTEFMDYIINTVSETVYVASENFHILEADPSKVSVVKFEGKVFDGTELVPELTKEMIAGALAQEASSAPAVTRVIEGKIINDTGIDLGPLDYIAEGRSSFWGSSPEREFNIRKALNERFNGVLIPPDAEFSYVDLLGPIEYAGWKQAYTIFKGTQLEKAPAGGVCQISTTVYRAALATALDITEHRSHSLYVIYYQHFGDGLDATVFPGEQDFKFKNNTGNYLLLVSQEEGYMEAVMRFYGEDDGRSTELYGPYTASTQTDESKAAVGSLGVGQIAWKYIIHNGDGTTETQWLLSDYLSPVQQHRGETPGLLEFKQSSEPQSS